MYVDEVFRRRYLPRHSEDISSITVELSDDGWMFSSDFYNYVHVIVSQT